MGVTPSTLGERVSLLDMGTRTTLSTFCQTTLLTGVSIKPNSLPRTELCSLIPPMPITSILVLPASPTKRTKMVMPPERVQPSTQEERSTPTQTIKGSLIVRVQIGVPSLTRERTEIIPYTLSYVYSLS